MSLKIVPLDTVSYSHSIAIMAISLDVLTQYTKVAGNARVTNKLKKVMIKRR